MKHIPKYILEPYKPGGSNRYECPFCHKKKCFTRFVNTLTGEYVGETCGRCDHENSCGGGLTPTQYYKENYIARNDTPPLSSCAKLGAKQSASPIVVKAQKTDIEKLDPVKFSIDFGYVESSFSENSMFTQWVKKILSPEEFKHVNYIYQLGATRHGAVIFWQIDKEGRVRTGKAMFYQSNGHRVHQDDFANFKREHRIEGVNSTTYYIHTKLMREKVVPEDWQLHQCFFGEHLLPYNPDADVCLVESEKTAILFAAKYPKRIWLATGGCKQINEEKMKPLQGRRIYVYPDSGEYENWKNKMKELGVTNCTVVKDLERYPKNTDIADVLLDEAKMLGK